MFVKFCLKNGAIGVAEAALTAKVDLKKQRNKYPSGKNVDGCQR
jgi:hypothetical protein